MDTFQPRLPLAHPYVNAPITAQNSVPLQNPVNVYFNSNPLNKNTPVTSALHTHINNGVQTPAPLRPSPKRPELVKPEHFNPY